MKALPISSSWSKISFQRNADCPAFNPTGHQVRCFQSKNFLNVGFLRCVKQKPLLSVSASTSPLSPDSETATDLEEAQSKTQESYQPNTVHVKFHLNKECSFGEQFALVGDDQMFGMWDPENAIPLNWSEGHVWTLELDIPIGKFVHFKFILREITGEILWQPGPDRILKTWETKNTIVVSEDWEDAAFQQVIEEGPIAGEPTGNSEMLFVADKLTTNSEMLVFAENLTHPKGDLVSDGNDYPANEQQPSNHEKPITVDNIPQPEETDTKEDPVEGINHEKDENKANLNKEAMTAGMNLASMNVEGNLVDAHEGDPFLVPGLPPSSAFPNDPVTHDEGETSLAFGASVVNDEVKNHNMPEVNP
ncbi:hypothetical protein MANES_08G091100v8 [Manihot esculenta]|uniref:CBM20 domain-containing protein n=1 Tax=Manihot esculenta TaxID=3983 RepID=A0A2C9VEQ0_MANES|nr:hypothetical protein MANES_08G091100v8 [Manihot esculenta]